MVINSRIISIPPHISTQWSNVLSIHMEEDNLLVNLKSGTTITIPSPHKAVVEKVFLCHSQFMEEKEQFIPPKLKTPTSHSSSAEEGGQATLPLNIPPLQMGFGPGFDGGFASSLKHDSELSDSPDLPQEVLKKISSLSKMIIPEGVDLPKGEPHCNCAYCQISKAIHRGAEEESDQMELGEKEEREEIKEEIVSDDELLFSNWIIEKKESDLYLIQNKLNSKESYKVFLGDPIGCTCGNKNCEHIVAVLKS